MFYTLTAFGLLVHISANPVPDVDTDPASVTQTTIPPEEDPIENIGIVLDSGTLIEGDVHMDGGFNSGRALDGSSSDSTIARSSLTLQHHNTHEKELWTNNIVPYQLDENFSEDEAILVKDALLTITHRSDNCVKFVQRSKEPDFIYITTRQKGCWSDIGRKGGNQTISVSRAAGCITSGVVIHEMMHALGFEHEHTRPDRNRYIRIVASNILFGKLSEFHIHANRKVLVPEYDYYSIMHYSTTQYSKDRAHRKTINILQDGIDESMVGQRVSLSENDVMKIKILYNCRRR